MRLDAVQDEAVAGICQILEAMGADFRVCLDQTDVPSALAGWPRRGPAA